VPKLSSEASRAPPSRYSTHTPDQSGSGGMESGAFGLHPPTATAAKSSATAALLTWSRCVIALHAFHIFLKFFQ
jgi:hypothetical protein